MVGTWGKLYHDISGVIRLHKGEECGKGLLVKETRNVKCAAMFSLSREDNQESDIRDSRHLGDAPNKFPEQAHWQAVVGKLCLLQLGPSPSRYSS